MLAPPDAPAVGRAAEVADGVSDGVADGANRFAQLVAAVFVPRGRAAAGFLPPAAAPRFLTGAASPRRADRALPSASPSEVAGGALRWTPPPSPLPPTPLPPTPGSAPAPAVLENGGSRSSAYSVAQHSTLGVLRVRWEYA
jgi:hypothetical protein